MLAASYYCIACYFCMLTQGFDKYIHIHAQWLYVSDSIRYASFTFLRCVCASAADDGITYKNACFFTEHTYAVTHFSEMMPYTSTGRFI